MEKNINDREQQGVIECMDDRKVTARVETVFGSGCTVGEALDELRSLYTDFTTAWLLLEEEENAPCSPSEANDHLFLLNCIIKQLEKPEESKDPKVTTRVEEHCDGKVWARVEEKRAERDAIDSLKESARILMELARSEREAMEQSDKKA